MDRESQSALLLGYAGTGKSLVLDRVLRSLAQEAISKGRGAAAVAAAGRGSGKRKRQKEDAPTGEEAKGGEVSPLPPPHRRQNEQQQQQQAQPFRAVYLNGAAQVDDGVAMREIVQQLGITGSASQGSVYNR